MWLRNVSLFVELVDIRKAMMRHGVMVYSVREWLSIEHKGNRAFHITLWYSKVHHRWRIRVSVHRNNLSAVKEVRPKPKNSSVRNAKGVMETEEQSFVVSKAAERAKKKAIRKCDCHREK